MLVRFGSRCDSASFTTGISGSLLRSEKLVTANLCESVSGERITDSSKVSLACGSGDSPNCARKAIRFNYPQAPLLSTGLSGLFLQGKRLGSALSRGGSGFGRQFLCPNCHSENISDSKLRFCPKMQQLTAKSA